MKTDFRIVSKPCAIAFDCPYCGDEIEISWEAANPPIYWGDPWDDVICPNCGKNIELGDWEYD